MSRFTGNTDPPSDQDPNQELPSDEEQGVESEKKALVRFTLNYLKSLLATGEELGRYKNFEVEGVHCPHPGCGVELAFVNVGKQVSIEGIVGSVLVCTACVEPFILAIVPPEIEVRVLNKLEQMVLDNWYGKPAFDYLQKKMREANEIRKRLERVNRRSREI